MEADGYTNADLVNLLSEGIELRSLVESATMTNEQIFLPKQRTLELVRSYTDDIKAFILYVCDGPLVSVETDSDDSSNNVEDIDDSSVSELEDTVVDDVSEGKEHNFSDDVEDTSNKEQFSDTNTVVESRQRTYFDILDYADLDESTGIFKLNDNFEKVEVNSKDFKAPIISDAFRDAMLYQFTAIYERVDENGEYYDNTDRGVYKPLPRFVDSIVKGVTVDGERVYAFNISSLRDSDDNIFDSSIWVTEESYQALLAAYAKYDNNDALFDEIASGYFDDDPDSWTDSVHINGYAVSSLTSTSSNEDDSDFLL